MIYLPSDIKWIKNVTNTEVGSAYMDKTQGEFMLHFPNQHKGNVTQPKVDDIILIYQKIGGDNVFTHLVTPVDNELRTENRTNYKYGRKVKILAYTSIRDVIKVKTTDWVNVNFQGISQGNACNIDNIKSVSESDSLKENSWNIFKRFFLIDFFDSVVAVASLNTEVEEVSPELSVSEGKQRLVTHFVRERNRDIVNQKKKNAIENDILFCEVCEFSFIEKFGVEFIECHHIKPISDSGERETNLDDLALVCPNCHRMLHKKIDGCFLSIEELRIIIKTNERTHFG